MQNRWVHFTAGRSAHRRVGCPGTATTHGVPRAARSGSSNCEDTTGGFTLGSGVAEASFKQVPEAVVPRCQQKYLRLGLTKLSKMLSI